MGDTKTVSIQNLIIWTDNPRMANEQILSESEAIQILIDEVGLSKMKVLAKDIFTYGLNPHRQPIVVSNSDETYNVYDGNRRISVIKCVLLGDNRFKGIENTIGLSLDTKIPVYITDVNEAHRLIEVEHSGESEGKGQIQWESFQRDYAFKQNNKQPAYPYAYEVSRICNLNRKSDFKKIPYTDLDTIFSNVIIKRLFGIENEWNFNDVDFIKTVYKKLHDAKIRVPYSRYLPRLNDEDELNKFKLQLFPEKPKGGLLVEHPSIVGQKQYYNVPSGGSVAHEHNKATPLTIESASQKIAENNNSEQEKRRNNSYKVAPVILFQWRGKGINIDDAVFKPTLEFSIGLQINTDMELRRIAAYLYRVLLEIALRHWCNWFKSNQNHFNTNNIEDYDRVKENLLGTTSLEVSFISQNKIKNAIQVLESIKNPAMNSSIRTCFKGRSVQSYADMVGEFNDVIHGSKEFIDKSTLEKYDGMVLNCLVALSISLNNPS